VRILVNCQSGIGINILAVPTLRAIKINYPDSYVHLIVQFRAGAKLLKSCPYIDEISVMNYEMARSPGILYRFVKNIRKKQYDYSFMLFPGNRLDKNIFHRLVNTKRRISHDYLYRKNLNFNFLNDTRIEIDRNAHDVEQNLGLLSVLDIDPVTQSKELELFLSPDSLNSADEILLDITKHKNIVGIHAGSSKDLTMELKRWPSGYFAELVDSLKELYDCEVLLFGSRDEEPVKQAIKAKAESGCEIVGMIDIQTTAALIRKCSLFVSNDSGLMHIAAAVGVRTVGIFGPTDPVRTAPYGAEHFVVKRDLDCSPCFSINHVGKKINCQRKERDCLVELKPEFVMNKIREKIGNVLTEEVKANAHN